MNTFNIITKTDKQKHLSQKHYDHIINAVIKHYAKHGDKVRNTGRTALVASLANDVGTTSSTVYSIIKKAKITTLTSSLVLKSELSSSASFNLRHSKRSNNLKLNSAKDFVDLVSKEVNDNPLSSIDETINYLKLYCPERIKGMVLICTKTMYNYVHAGIIDLKPIDLPRTVQRKKAKSYKTYINKRQKGTSITQRPFNMDDRSEFGHWEGDLVTGPRDGQNGAILTLIERKTRFYYMIPIKSKSSKKVLMQINKLKKLYGKDFNNVFKSITFDNGNEFSRYKDMEKKYQLDNDTTIVYFGRPYRSCDRGSNENCNGLIRYFIKKGTNINNIPKSVIYDINLKINNKKRKLLGYQPATNFYKKELKK